jgi:ELWxxDGT repeat protein
MSHITTFKHHDSRGGAAASPDKPAASRRRLRHIGAVLAGSIMVAALLLVLANLAFAQSAQKKKAQPDLKPFLVEDIYPGKTGSEPNQLVNFKGRLLFAANHPKFGEEMWKSDGTRKGTELLKDINRAAPAPTTDDCKSEKSCTGSSWVDDMTLVGKSVAGRRLYFTANDGKRGVELWKSDGTKRGTKLLKSINPSSASEASEISSLVALRKRLYFSANDGKHGIELWKSDGTRSSTKLVKDINPGKAGSDANDLTAYKGRVLFTADDGVHGTEMWRSNGTKANTNLLINLEPGAVGSEPGELTTSGPFLYFAASTPSAGEELWAVLPRGIGR